jgi:cytochrome b subunit of formate dehydrogenase
VAVARPRVAGRFLLESLRFRRSEWRWFVRHPGFLLRPGLRSPARHEGHFDPGQRALNLVVVVSFLVLSGTGVVLSFPQAFTPTAFGWSLRVHRGATWALAVAVAGHVVVASGVLPAYRGVWRAMHGDGRVDASLARRLWPRWAEEARGEGRPVGPDALP